MKKKNYRTTVYVDGFNFYYGALKGTPWKWQSLRLVKARHHKLIGVITPGAPTRKTSWQLRKHAAFVAPIRTWALESSQLPDPIPGTTISKPARW